MPDNYIARTWNTDSGLPHNSVRALVQTCDGYLWLGTPAGLVRFDGVRFAVYDQWNTPALKSGRILSLYEDGDAVLWIGTDGGGLCTYRDGEWRDPGERMRLADNHVRAVAADLRGNLWIGTEYGLHRLDGEAVRTYGLEDGLADNLVTALAADGGGRIWTGTMRGGLAGFEDGLVQTYDFDDGLRSLAVLSLSAGPAGDVWIGTMNGLFSLRPEEGIVRPVAGTLRYPVTSLITDSAGRLLVGTMVEGLKILDGSAPGDIFTDAKLGTSHVRALLLDRDGYVWIGTESSGLVQLKERRVGTVTAIEELSLGSVPAIEGPPLGSVYALLEDSDGTLWIGTENSGLYRMRIERTESERVNGGHKDDGWMGDAQQKDGRIMETLNRSQGLAGDMVRALLRDRSGGLWVGTMDGGLSIISGGRIRSLTVASGLPSDDVTAILQDRTGAVWIGTDRGLSRYSNGKIQQGGAARTLGGRTIRTLYEDEGGMLYAGTRFGLWRLAGSVFERIDADSGKPELDVLSLYEDGGGLWIGTNGTGLLRLADNGASSRTTAYTTNDGLPGNFIYSLSGDDAGLLWMSCEAGVFSISRDSLAAYAGGASRVLAPALYDEHEGMPSARCNGFCQPAVCLSRSGERFYPTKDGIAVFGKNDGREQPHPPVVRIESILADEVPVGRRTESILADEVPVGMSNGIELSHRTHRIEIRFTAFDYSAPEKCRFLYRLKGYDNAFTAVHPGQGRTAAYRNLPPGEYEFTVRAVGNGGLWSDGAAAVSFGIVPPFYRTRAFPFIVAAAVILAGCAAAAALRYRRIVKRRGKYSTTAIDAQRMERAIGELNALMETEKVFLDPDMTLKKLAQRLRIHYNHLSRIINERFGTGFNDYLNRYRIEEACRRLSDPAESGRSILQIMYDAGFYSKSTFNTAFRKFTGTSPSEYRRKHR